MASLTPSEVTRFRDRLRARDLSCGARFTVRWSNAEDKTYAEVAGRVLDVAEESVASMFADDKILMIKKEVAEQTDVVAALARITDGTYGPVSIARKHRCEAARCLSLGQALHPLPDHYERQYQSGGRDTTPSL